MNQQARIIALKLALSIINEAGENGEELRWQLTNSEDLKDEVEKLSDSDINEIGEEMNTIIGKFQAAIKVLENPDNFTVGPDDVKLDV